MYQIFLPEKNITLSVGGGENLLTVLRDAGIAPEAPCGGQGRCRKCTVLVDDSECLACRTLIDHDMTVKIPEKDSTNVLLSGIETGIVPDLYGEGYLFACDIGTTTVAAYLLDGMTGRELAGGSRLNPQAPFGADVVSRIQAAINGNSEKLTVLIRDCLEELCTELCKKADIIPAQIGVVSVVGNPAMHQLFMGISVKNLTEPPFPPVFTHPEILPAGDYLPVCENAKLLVVPDISGYVGSDMTGCLLTVNHEDQENTAVTLLIDIGTNGEMALWNGRRMIVCSTAAGPALEGARIRFGMRGAPGAIDHVRTENGSLKCSVIGDGKATGICGSGLIDAVASALEAGKLNHRGRILCMDEIDGERYIPLRDSVYLTQEDIREVMLAKGAIAAGIELMAEHMGICVEQIEKVYLAGAFGTFMDPQSACRIGLIPAVLEGKIQALGNAAGSGAKRIACSKKELQRARAIRDGAEFLELAEIPGFSKCFAKNMLL